MAGYGVLPSRACGSAPRTGVFVVEFWRCPVYHVNLAGVDVQCDTVEEVRAILPVVPAGCILQPGNARQRTRLIRPAARGKGKPRKSAKAAARSANASRAGKRAWALAHAYAAKKKLSAREAFRAIHSDAKEMAKAEQLLQSS